jgi:tetratricopeptide (TPR) repeat protein
VPWRASQPSLLLGLLILPARAAQDPPVPAAFDCAVEVHAEAREEALRLYGAGLTAAQAEGWDEARDQLQRAVELDAQLAPAQFALGQAHMALRQYAAAVKAFTGCRAALRCLREAPSGPSAERQAQRLDESIRVLEDTIRRLERDRLARAAIPAQEANRSGPAPLGQTFGALQKLEGQLAELRGWRKQLGSEPPELPLSLGNAHFNAGSLAEAELEFQAALRLKPGWGDAFNNLAVVYMLTGRLAESEQAMKRAEQAGVPASPRLKEEIRKRKADRPAAPSPPP